MSCIDPNITTKQKLYSLEINLLDIKYLSKVLITFYKIILDFRSEPCEHK